MTPPQNTTPGQPHDPTTTTTERDLDATTAAYAEQLTARYTDHKILLGGVYAGLRLWLGRVGYGDSARRRAAAAALRDVDDLISDLQALRADLALSVRLADHDFNKAHGFAPDSEVQP